MQPTISPAKCEAALIDGRWRCARCDTSWDSPEVLVCMRELRKTPADILDAGATTFRERNLLYGDNYKRLGATLLAIFPEGKVPEITTVEAANRLNLFIDCLAKLQRYAHNFTRGGHRDSAHDLMVYAAILEEMTDESC